MIPASSPEAGKQSIIRTENRTVLRFVSGLALPYALRYNPPTLKS
jgi:hypothetical protein